MNVALYVKLVPGQGLRITRIDSGPRLREGVDAAQFLAAMAGPLAVLDEAARKVAGDRPARRGA